MSAFSITLRYRLFNGVHRFRVQKVSPKYYRETFGSDCGKCIAYGKCQTFGYVYEWQDAGEKRKERMRKEKIRKF